MHSDSTKAFVDLYSHLAHGFAKIGVLPKSQLLQYRQVIPELSQLESTRSGLKFLSRHCPDMYQSLVATLGEVSLFSNQLRFMLRQPLRNLSDTIASFAGQLESKTALFLNQPVYVRRQNQWERQGAYVTLITEILARTEALHGDLVSEELVYEYLPAQTLLDEFALNELDRLFGEGLLFRRAQESYLPLFPEALFLRSLTHRLRLYLLLWESTYRIIWVNSQNANEMRSFSAISAGVNQSLSNLEVLGFSPDDQIFDWDQQGNRMLASLKELNCQLRQFYDEMVGLLNPQSLIKEHPAPKSLERRVTITLISKGISSLKASSAAQALIQYCQQWDIRPSEIDSLELPKIHPLLDSSTLSDLKEVDWDRSLNLKLGGEKEIALIRVKKIMESLHKNIGTLLILGCVVLTNFSCGVKTAPVSNVLDLRPDIPYKNPSPKETETTQKVPKNQQQSEQQDEPKSN